MKMTRYFLLVVALMATPSLAQGSSLHLVDTIGASFVDRTGGANVTTIELGETVVWNFVSGFVHTITSGSDSGAPDAGNLFDELGFSTGDVFSYTPTDAGTIRYFCRVHEAINMKGTIVVIDPNPTPYPGSDDDLVLETGVNGTPDSICSKDAEPGDQVSLLLRSPGQNYNGVAGIIGGQVFPSGAVMPGSPPQFPELWLSPGNTTVFQFGLLTPTGLQIGGTVPPGLDGLTVFVQGLVFSSLTNNGVFASTDGKLIVLVDAPNDG